MKHGTASTYRNKGCRCDACRAAQTVATREFRAKNRDWWERQSRRDRVRSRALAALAERHPEEFEQLLSAEYAREREEQPMTVD